MTAPAPPTRRPPRPSATGEMWRANPFHRVRLGETAPDRIASYGRDPRLGDAERGRELGRGVWRIGAERIAGAYANPWDRPHP